MGERRVMNDAASVDKMSMFNLASGGFIVRRGLPWTVVLVLVTSACASRSTVVPSTTPAATPPAIQTPGVLSDRATNATRVATLPAVATRMAELQVALQADPPILVLPAAELTDQQ